MNKHLASATSIAIAALLGCSTPQPEPQSQPTRVPAAQTRPASQADNAEHTPIGVPYVLELLPPAPSADGKSVEIAAEIIAASALKDAIEVSVVLPPGATLSVGSAKERIEALPAGKTLRKFKIESDQPLTSEHPVKIAVDLKAAGGGYGVHAERFYPAPEARVARRSPAVPPPPVRRPPIPASLTAVGHH